MSPSPSTSLWSAVLHLTPGSAFYLSRLGLTGRHRHHALQVCVGAAAPFRLRTGTRGEWECLQAATVHAEVAHQFDGRDGLCAMLYLEPELGSERADPKSSGSNITPLENERLEAFRAEMIVVAAQGFAPDAVRGLHQRLRSIAGRERPEQSSGDSRVGRLLHLMRESPAQPWSLDDAARALLLSPSRVRHLFMAETGTTLRRFRRWIRLEAALRSLVDGQSLTTAAYAAGFADSAHLSRAFREMFGLTPSGVTGAARILVDSDWELLRDPAA